MALAPTPPGAERVAIVRSPTLTQIVNTTDVYSDNFFAEMLIKLLGARFGDRRARRRPAPAVVERIRPRPRLRRPRRRRLRPDPLQPRLARARSSACCWRCASDPAGDEFIQDLALAGKEGTVADRMHGTAAYGRCRTKTGTLTGVSNLSGYCFDASGRIMAFSILMNGVRDLGLRPPRAGPHRRPCVASY